MKIVLSRKGYDGTNGGMPSPVFKDEKDSCWHQRMFSLPIPEVAKNQARTTGVTNQDIRYPIDFEVKTNTPKNDDGSFYVHLDPDIREELHHSNDDWNPLFGQEGTSESVLRDNGIGDGSLFLFFGRFQFYVRSPDNGRWIKEFGSKPFHAIWGYMQVSETMHIDCNYEADENVKEKVDKYSWHPHCSKVFRETYQKNTLYIGNKENQLKIGKKVIAKKSYGIFRYDPCIRLSADDLSCSKWSLKLPWIDLKGKNSNMEYNPGIERFHINNKPPYFQTQSPGQEFVVKKEIDEFNNNDTIDWLQNIFKHVETRDWSKVLCN